MVNNTLVNRRLCLIPRNRIYQVKGCEAMSSEVAHKTIAGGGDQISWILLCKDRTIVTVLRFDVISDTDRTDTAASAEAQLYKRKRKLDGNTQRAAIQRNVRVAIPFPLSFVSVCFCCLSVFNFAFLRRTAFKPLNTRIPALHKGPPLHIHRRRFKVLRLFSPTGECATPKSANGT